MTESVSFLGSVLTIEIIPVFKSAFGVSVRKHSPVSPAIWNFVLLMLNPPGLTLN